MIFFLIFFPHILIELNSFKLPETRDESFILFLVKKFIEAQSQKGVGSYKMAQDFLLQNLREFFSNIPCLTSSIYIYIYLLRERKSVFCCSGKFCLLNGQNRLRF